MSDSVDLPIGFRPFLSCAISIDEVLAWPKEKKELYTYSIKYDGVRLLITNKEVYTRNLKPIANRALAKFILDNWNRLELREDTVLDCELTHSLGFATANKTIQTADLFSDYAKLNIRIFDAYVQRKNYTDRESYNIEVHGTQTPNIYSYVVNSCLINLTQGVHDFILGPCKHEGIMIRKKRSNYKFGRATKEEATYFKVKPSYDSEAIIIGLHEGEVNINPKKINELGLTKRSSHQSGKRGNGTLGTITCIDINPESPFYHRQFSIGTFEGLIDKDLYEIWLNPNNYMEKKFTYKYASVASKGLPRHPVFQRFIHKI
jgi:hypothetical protein